MKTVSFSLLSLEIFYLPSFDVVHRTQEGSSTGQVSRCERRKKKLKRKKYKGSEKGERIKNCTERKVYSMHRFDDFYWHQLMTEKKSIPYLVTIDDLTENGSQLFY